MRLACCTFCICALLAGCRTSGPAKPLAVGEGITDPRLSAEEHAFSEALAHFASGVLLEDSGSALTRDVLGAYGSAISRDLDAPEANYLRLSELQFRTGKRDAAMATLAAAHERYPESYEVLMRTAAYAQVLDEHDQVLDLVARAVPLAPDNPIAYARGAYAHMQKLQPQQALELIEDALPEVEDSDLLIDTLPLVASSFRRNGDPRSALTCYRYVLIARPANYRVQEEIVRSHVEAKDPDAARTALEALMQFETLPEQYAMTLGTLFELVGDAAAAIRYYKQAVKEDPESSPAYFRLAALYLRDGEARKAVAFLEHIAGATPKNDRLLTLLGDIYDKLDEVEKAVALYERACDVATSTTPHLRLAVLHMQRDETDAAKRVLQDALTAYPLDVAPYTLLGWVHLSASDYADAIDAFESVSRIATEMNVAAENLNPMFHFWAGSAYERNQDYASAATYFKAAIERDPESAQALNYLAYMWAEQNQNLDEALPLARRALEIEPDSAAYLDTLGWIYYQKGSYRKALKHLKRANALLPDDPVVSEHLGDAYAATKRNEDAITFWKHSLRHDTSSEAVREKLSQAGVDVAAYLNTLAVEPEPDADAPDGGE